MHMTNTTPPVGEPQAPLTASALQTGEAPLKGWDWGASGVPWAWTLYHKAWGWFVLSLFLPFVTQIILGIMGHNIAWRSVEWRDAEEFIRSQQRWRTVGIVTLIIIGAWFVLMMIGMGVIWAIALSQGAFRNLH